MIKSIIKNLLFPDSGKRQLKKYSSHIRLGKGTRLENFQLEIRNPVRDLIYFEAGEDCVISGKFVFELADSKISIGNNTFIGGGLFISAEHIRIGNNVMISWNCTVTDNDAHSVNPEERREDVRNWKKGIDDGIPWKYKDWSKVKKAPVQIEDNAWIGFNSILLKGVRIGNSAIIGAGSVVTGDVDDFMLAAGNPAKQIKSTV
jgi:acetyltransferase-like isoleucine patch superfamily enzyme